MKSKILMALLLANSAIYAQDTEQTESNYKWSGSGQLGYSSSSGNSDNENITAGLKIVLETNKWISDIILDILQSTSSGVDTADRYTMSTKTGYKYNAKNYFYYGTRYDKDNFSGNDYTMTAGIGWGHKFFDTDTQRIITEFGLGYKTEAIDTDRSEINGVAFLGKLDYMRQLSETMTFENLTILESTSDNTFIQNDAGFSFKVSTKLKLKLAHQYRHNTDVQVGIDSTDTLVSTNLVYDF